MTTQTDKKENTTPVKTKKVSELITSLTYMKETFGDLDVVVVFEADGKVTQGGTIWVNYNGNVTPDKDDISIQNFPY